MTGLLLVCVVLQSCLALDIMTPLRDNEIVYVCEGEDLVLPWNLTLEPNEELVDIQWRFDSNTTHEMMGMFANDEFLPTHDYTNRLQHVGAGLLMSGMTRQDSGDYTITISAHSGGSYLRLTTTAKVQMAEPPVVVADQLKVTQEPVAVYDNATGQWYLTLTCGTFTDLGYPPVEVLWTTPTGQTTTSSEYNDGNFILRLPNPVPGGNFTCEVPAAEPGHKCLAKDSHLRQDTVAFPDEKQEKIAALVQENALLKAENSQLRSGNSSCDQGTGFMAIVNPNPLTVSTGDRLMPSQVLVNEGRAFDPSTGIFTAPASGIYFFYGTAVSDAFTGTTNDLIGFGGQSVVEYTKSYESARHNLQSSVIWDFKHLKAGDQVYVISTGRGQFDPYNTAFGGFLMSVD